MIKLASIALLGLTLTVIVTPALANPIIFAEYQRASSTPGFTLVSTPLAGGSGNVYNVVITGGGQISFDYLVGGTVFGRDSQSATLSLTASTTLTGNCPAPGDACVTDGFRYTESGYSGSFSILLDSAFGGRRNLLSGTFGVSPSGASLTSIIGRRDGTLEATTSSANANQLVFTSDFLKVANSVSRDATFSLSNFSRIFEVITNTGLSNRYPINFTAFGSGEFAEDLTVPEPSTFALLAIALVGLCLWQRKRRHSHR